jgi:hypothetical protein
MMQELSQHQFEHSLLPPPPECFPKTTLLILRHLDEFFRDGVVMGRCIDDCPGSGAVSPRGNPEGAVHGPDTFSKKDLAEKTEARKDQK